MLYITINHIISLYFYLTRNAFCMSQTFYIVKKSCTYTDKTTMGQKKLRHDDTHYRLCTSLLGEVGDTLLIILENAFYNRDKYRMHTRASTQTHIFRIIYLVVEVVNIVFMERSAVNRRVCVQTETGTVARHQSWIQSDATRGQYLGSIESVRHVAYNCAYFMLTVINILNSVFVLRFDSKIALTLRRLKCFIRFIAMTPCAEPSVLNGTLFLKMAEHQ